MLWFGVIFLSLGMCKGQDITFDLSNYRQEVESTHVKKIYTNLTDNVSKIAITNYPESVGFWVIQVHSYIINVTLSISKEFEDTTTISGTNIGLAAERNTTFYVKAANQTLAFIAVIIYGPKDPIPGGCNLTFRTENAPYQIVSTTDEIIIVESQPPKINGLSCDKNNATVDLYHMYLHEYDFESARFFTGIENMLTVDKIKANGYKVKTANGKFKYRKLYAAYRGVGHVFAIVATYANHSSAYVPAISYGCNLNNLAESCYGPVTRHWKVLCAFMLIFGFFVCFFGHKYFRFTLFIMGAVVGILVTYVILFNDMNELSIGDITTSSIVAGLIGGIVWLIFWLTCGLPILSASFTYSLFGFLIASIVFYSGAADTYTFHNNSIFWLTFSAILIIFYGICLFLYFVSHPLGCSCLGAYAFVAALNYYWGGNLQYIIINIFRRIAVEDFNQATIDPPFQFADIAQSILLVTMSTFGFYYQMCQQGSRPPFPPSVSFEGVATENTPLNIPTRGKRFRRRRERSGRYYHSFADYDPF